MKITLKQIDSKLVYISLFIMFAYWPGEVLGSLIVRLVIIGLLLLLLLKRENLYLDHNLFLVFLLLLFCQFITILLGSRNLALDMGNISALCICLLVVSVVGKEEFFHCYLKLMYFLCVFSLITYVLFLIVPTYFYKLPTVQATSITANAFFSLVPLKMNDYYRNFGCWNEPGMYAVYLSAAMLLELFYIKKTNIKHIVVLILCMITTFSTAGYVAMILLLVAFLIQTYHRCEDKLNRKTKRRIWFLVLVGGGLFVFIYSNGYLGNRSYVFKKLTEISEESGTTVERIRAVKLAIHMIMRNFLVGGGWGEFAELMTYEGNIMTATPLNWFAVYGLIYGCLMNLGIVRMVNKLIGSKHLLIFTLAYLGIVASIVSQEVSSTFLIILFVFYAYKSDKRGLV